MASWLRKLGRAASGITKVARFVPGIGAAASVLDLGISVAQAAAPAPRAGPSLPGLPMLPALPGAPMPAMPFGAPVAAAPFAMQAAARAGMAAPALTIDLIRQLQAAGLLTGFSQLRTFHRSPRPDQVVVRWPGGGIVALNKRLARAWGLWKSAKKPVISVGESEAVNKANRVVKKFSAFEKKIRKVANFRAGKARPRNIIIEAPGKKLIGKKVA